MTCLGTETKDKSDGFKPKIEVMCVMTFANRSIFKCGWLLIWTFMVYVCV